MNANLKTAVSILLITPVVVIIGLLIPIPESWTGSWAAFHIPLAIVMAYAWLHFGAVALFLSGLRVYKAVLRYAYVSLSICITLIALGTLAIVVLRSFGLLEVIVAGPAGGLVAAPFFLAGLAVYLGMRQLGRAVYLQSMLTRLWIAMPTVIAICVASMLLPHMPSATPEIGFDVSIAIALWGCLLNFLSALIVLKIKRRIGQHYVSAMAWLFAVLVMAGVIQIGALLFLLIFDAKNQSWGMALDITGLLLGLLWLKAGYTFSKTREV